MTSQSNVFTPSTLADRWGCSKTTIIRMMKRGDLERAQFPLIRFSLAQVERIERGEQKTAQGVVYFVKSGALVKIGHTKDPIYRMRSLAASSPLPVELLKTTPGSLQDEKAFHTRFSEYREHGEWFSFEGDLKEYLEGSDEHS